MHPLPRKGSLPEACSAGRRKRDAGPERPAVAAKGDAQAAARVSPLTKKLAI